MGEKANAVFGYKMGSAWELCCRIKKYIVWAFQRTLNHLSMTSRSKYTLSKAVPHVLIRCLNVKLSQYQFSSCFSHFQQKMLLLEIAFFHDFGDFGQRLLTACWPPMKFEIGNLERVIWTPFLPNIMVRNLIFASGGQKKLFFCPQANCWNNNLQIHWRILKIAQRSKDQKVPTRLFTAIFWRASVRGVF